MEKLLGAGIVFLSTILYASIYPLLKKANQEISPFTIMAITTGVVFLFALIASIVFENALNIKGNLLKNNLQILLAVGVINFFAFWLAIIGFKHMLVWQQDMFYLITPVAAGILAYLLLGEKVSSNLFIGLVVMGIGLYIAVR